MTIEGKLDRVRIVKGCIDCCNYTILEPCPHGTDCIECEAERVAEGAHDHTLTAREALDSIHTIAESGLALGDLPQRIEDILELCREVLFPKGRDAHRRAALRTRNHGTPVEED
jgi:hypothetical protein